MPTFSHAPVSQDDLAAARAGSTEALGRLSESWRPALVFRARKRLHPSLRALFDPEDVAQDALTKAVERFPDFRGETLAQAWSWIGRILDHTLDDLDRDCHRQVRDVARETRISRSGAARDLLEGLAEVTETPPAALEWQEQLAGVRQAMAELLESHRTVVRLYFWEDLPYAEIGWRLGLTRDVAKKRARQAVQRMRRRLDHLP